MFPESYSSLPKPKRELDEESTVPTRHTNTDVATKKPRNSWHAYTEALDTLILLGGITLVLGAIVLMPTLISQIVGAAVGLLLVEASAWGSTRRLLSGQRKYHALWAEVDHFLDLVKQLNHAALIVKEDDTPEAQQAFEHTCAAMEQSVNHMMQVAGKTRSDVAEQRFVRDRITMQIK
jgi:hypothetical protein